MIIYLKKRIGRKNKSVFMLLFELINKRHAKKPILFECI